MGCFDFMDRRTPQVQEEPRRLGWVEENLPGRRKRDTRKAAMARRLRPETTTCPSAVR